MKRILALCMLFIGIIYSLPFLNGEKKLNDIDLSFVSDFSVPFASISSDNEVLEEKNILVSISNEIVEINIEDFLIGVLAAEMPASFELEALKAQAVAGRTYIYYKEELISQNLSDNVHVGAIVCDNPSHCKAYINLEQNNPWGSGFDEYYAKMKQAVDETSGEFMVYDDTPIASVFHSTSSEKTESALDVWGTDIPYLQTVDSVGYEDSPKYLDEVFVLNDTFKNSILSRYATADFSGESNTWFKKSTRSEAGGVLEVYVGGVLISGTEIREMFKLNSTNFTVDFDDENVIFNTKGYGHGVGMSQYGANALAQDGYEYSDILTFYYSDIIIKK